jgi:hypothetical protein
MPTVFATNASAQRTKRKTNDENGNSSEHLLISHITIYRSGVMLVGYLIGLEFIFLFINLLIHFVLSYIAPSMNSNTFLSVNAIISIVITLIKIIFMLLIVVQWLDSYYEIRPNKVVYKTGLFKRQEREFDCPDIEQITLSEGFWGRLLHFGTITIYVKINNDSFTLSNIPNPHRNLKLLQKALNSKQVNIILTDELIDE